jgi:uncharacterized protein YcfJ
MFSKAMIPVLATTLVLVAPAMADPDYGYQDDRPADQAGPDYDYARVLHVEPHYRQVRISVPRQECYAETRYVQDQRSYGGERPAAGGMILGGLIGAVIGHQIGHGHERGVGTVAGAVIGSAVGHDAAQRSAGGPDDGYYDDRGGRPVERQRCVTRYSDSVEQRIDGYRVEYRYNDRNYQTDLPYDPGERLRVRVTVNPEG